MHAQKFLFCAASIIYRETKFVVDDMKDLSKNNRLSDKERRDFTTNESLASDSLERRRRPDRRMGGVDVQVVDVTETAFMNFVDEFKLNK